MFGRQTLNPNTTGRHSRTEHNAQSHRVTPPKIYGECRFHAPGPPPIGQRDIAIEVDLMPPLDKSRSPRVDKPAITIIGLWDHDFEGAGPWSPAPESFLFSFVFYSFKSIFHLLFYNVA